MKISSICFLLLLWMLLSIEQGTYAVPSQTSNYLHGYNKRVLFTAPVGNQSQNIGLDWERSEGAPGRGVCTLRVRGKRIYIGDTINGAVKVFDFAGRYLAKAEGKLQNLRTLVVNSQGDIFTLSGAGRETISKFSSTGHLLWSVNEDQVLSAASKDSFGPLIYPTAQGGVAIETARYIKPIPPQNRLALLDTGGKFIKIMDADFCDEAGFYKVRRADKYNVPTPSFKATMQAFTWSGQLSSTRQLSMTPKIKALLSETVANLYPALGTIRRLPEGMFYSVSKIVSQTRVNFYPINSTTPYDTGMQAVVISYANSGQPVRAFRFPAPIFDNFDPAITTDEQGNVYTIEYAPKVVKVVRYKWQGASKK